jgi:predicted RNA-binding Zn-ribbon protein involved in translation (DUF1610 family)
MYRPDIIISDFNLPLKRGDEVLEEITVSMGIVTVKRHLSYIDERLALKINELQSETGALLPDNLHDSALADLLVEMADQALYTAKKTFCTSCKFNSGKSELFIDNKCPQCGSPDLIFGRNKIDYFGTAAI